MGEMVGKMVIDEERKYVLTRYTKTKKGVRTKESDHHSIITEVNVDWNKYRETQTLEIYNLKNKEGQKKFKEMTSRDNFLSNTMQNKDKDINTRTKKFLKRIGYCISKCFKKVRIKQSKRNKTIENLFNKRRILRTKEDETSIEELSRVEEELAEMCAEDNKKLIEGACAGLASDEGGINSGKLWKLKKRLRGLIQEPPTAMLDDKGNLVTTNSAIEELTLKMYKERLSNLKIKDDLKVHQVRQEDLCKERLEQAQHNKTPEWTMEDLNKVLKQLKENKSRDPLGFANELFRPETAGEDLKKAILDLMNEIKSSQIFPERLGMCNITSLYKNKGSRRDFENYRGIFRVTIIRSIMDKLIYEDEFENVDNNLTDTNVGARKNRNIRDNIFVMNAVINHAIKKKVKGIDVQLFDAYKCFDKLWLQECINDIYDAGFQSDKLPLLVKENANAKVAVKVRGGITKRINISNVVMQGTVWGSALCTSTMDKLAKSAYEKPEMLYKYHSVPIPPLGMVDDIITVTDASLTAKMNSEVNKFMESKKLLLSEKKCIRIHIGKSHDMCPELKVHEGEMKTGEKEKYLGDTISCKGTLDATIESRKAKGLGIVAEILSILKEIPLGNHTAKMGMILREAMFVNGILFNSEAWHGITQKHINALQAIDESLLRGILKAHAKTPREFLYLELGAIPLKWIITQRRLNYQKTIIDRAENELIKKVYNVQKENPVKGDFVKLVQKDWESLGIHMNETHIAIMSKTDSKRYIKLNVRDAVLKELRKNQASKTKIKGLLYEKLQIQDYLVCGDLSDREANTIAALRANCVRGVRSNFKKMYKDTKCPLKCGLEDSQKHILECPNLTNTSNVSMDHLNGNNAEKKELAKVFAKLTCKRKRLLELDGETPPGATQDQCT
jgi:hypothetical protein